MGIEAWICLGVVLLVFGLLLGTRLAPDMILVGAVALLLLAGVLTSKEAIAGMSNEGMLTIAVLSIVGAGLRETGAIDWMAGLMLGRPKSILSAMFRLTVPTAAISGFVNNTPLVQMLIPVVSDWSKKHQLPASKLMLPLSYAAILGGTCTLIGTSTNLVVDGLVRQEMQRGNVPSGLREIEMFDVTWIGAPCALAGVAVLLLAHRWLLPNRQPVLQQLADAREYTVEMLVAADSPLVGKSIEQAGLRHLPGVFLAEIDREGDVLAAVSPEERLRANDRLLFVGVVDSVVDLQRIRGLQPATDQLFKLSAPRSHRCLIEAVVSNSSPLTGKTIRDGKFRSVYRAVVIAVSRNGERIRKKIGDIVLEPGDTLLLETHPSFVDEQRNNRDFFLVSRLDNTSPPRHERALIALGIFGAMIAAAGIGWTSLLVAGMVAAGAMIATRCCSARIARKYVDWELLVAIAAAFGLGTALEKTGAARFLAENLVGLAGSNPWLSLGLVYFVTMVTTELITNNAAAALMFPLAMATAERLQVNPMPFVFAIMMAASACFSTPIGYQTNLMVMGPGGYRSTDYLRAGLPLNIICAVVTIALIPLIWPF